MSNPPRAPSPNVARKPLSTSLFNPPDLPPLSAHVASEAAIHGTTQAPPPTPPPKDRPPESKAPPQHNQHGRPGTPDFFLQNSTYSMPGAYPTTPSGNVITRTRTHSSSPLAAESRSQNNDTEAPYTPEPATPSPGKRRASGNSIRTLLSSLRRPSSQSPRDPRASGDSYSGNASNRPDSPGRDSMASSIRPSLRKKMSGTFWGKRKSSLGMEMMMNKGEQSTTEPRDENTPFQENGHSVTPEHPTSSPPTEEASETGSMLRSIRQRKSGTFWSRRKSSMGTELNADALVQQEESQDRAGDDARRSGPSSPTQLEEPLRKKKSGTFWPRKLSLSLQRETDVAQQRGEEDKTTVRSPASDTMTSPGGEPEDMTGEDTYVHVERPRSPPPKLPELSLDVGDGHGSFINGGAEDLFGSIGRD